MKNLDRFLDFFCDHSILIFGSMATMELLCLLENRLKEKNY